MMSLWCNFSVNVYANSSWNGLLIYASKIYWILQPTAVEWSTGFNEMLRALRAQHVSLNSACTWTVSKWFRRNNGHLPLHIWPLQISCHCLGSDARSFLKAFPVAKYSFSFWVKSRTGENTKTFPQNKDVPSFRKRLIEYVKACRRHFENLL